MCARGSEHRLWVWPTGRQRLPKGSTMTEHQGHDDNDQVEGTGPEGTIPDSKDGVAVGSTDEPSHFEVEEDTSSAGTDGNP